MPETEEPKQSQEKPQENRMPKDEMREIVDRANRPEATPDDIKAVRRLMRERPNYLNSMGDPVMRATERCISLDRGSPGLQEIYRLRVEQMTQELASEHDGAIEKLLVKYVALCWLRLGIVEQDYSNVMNSDQSLEVKAYWERRLAATQKRFQKAGESLARVRKLTRPPKSKVKIDSFNAIVSNFMETRDAAMKILTENVLQATPPARSERGTPPVKQNNKKKSKP